MTAKEDAFMKNPSDCRPSNDDVTAAADDDDGAGGGADDVTAGVGGETLRSGVPLASCE